MGEDLIERLEKATVGGWELNYEIEQTVGDWINLGGYWRQHKVTGARERYYGNSSPPYTTSLDAIVALIEEKLPGWEWNAVSGGRSALYSPDEHDAIMAGGSAQTTPLSLCIALLRALHPQPGDKP